ncbi:lipase 3-like isoform X2 [Daktulosphaira vitifoliae]|uniref:lipase 3-like isoform X2 n=1 Tax=Daktulosphaira vitifoliae TaxID=58002 RepID=UPI0021A979B6|nr:lipase 3-like isoform X2 [Daktulosphaira vitifoliae]
MELRSVLSVITLACASVAVNAKKSKILGTEDLIENHGHRHFSRHTIPTDDRYLIDMFRIKGHGGPPFLLLHALMGASDQWFLRDRQHDLPSILVNSGYDVWLGDFRGNIYSRKHESLNVSSAEYWKFSIDEWIYYDLPAMIDYVCKESGYDKIYIVTYSLSSAVFFSTVALRPEYNEKVIVSYHLAPFVAFSNVKSVLLRLGIQFGPQYLTVARGLNIHELFPRNEREVEMYSSLCSKNSTFLKSCTAIVSDFFGLDTSGNSTKDLDFKLAYSRAGVSLNSIDHLLQMLRTKKMQHYDLGFFRNWKTYGQYRPPEYDLRKVTSPSVLFHSYNDRIVDKRTIDKLAVLLPNVHQTFNIKDRHFGHVDYAFNKKAKHLVFDNIIENAKQFRS